MMKKGTWQVIVIALILFLAPHLYAQHGLPTEEAAPTKPQSKGAEIVSQLKFKPLVFMPPKPERRVLSNGMVLYLLEDHDLPLINITAKLKTGAIYEPPEKAGLASLTGHVMRSGGTISRTAEEINRELEYIAASVETGIDRESGVAGLSVLKKDLDKALEIFADVLMNPAFPEDKIKKRKEEVLEAIRRENDQPGQIVFREFRRLLYEPHPYGRKVEGYVNTLANITREDMAAFHERYFHPNNIILGVSGDFDALDIVEKLEKVFSSWPKEEINFPTVPKVKDDFRRSVNYIYKDIEQSNVILGHLGIERTNPDYFPVTIMNFILGGGSFAARIPGKVRTEEGLAYSVYSAFHTPRDLGFFFVNCQTKSESTARAISITLEEVSKIKEKSVEDEELAGAKDTFTNQFVFLFTSSAAIVSHMVDIEYQGLPLDYLDTYVEKVQAVTKEDIQRVAQKYLHPDKVTLLVIGNQSRFDRPLSDFGQVSTIELQKID
ncbi:MAG TPA: M16 family metallopeptidase [Candidatus Hypogeohydataceae bacterium YC38]